jgi:hypothetical protein
LEIRILVLILKNITIVNIFIEIKKNIYLSILLTPIEQKYREKTNHASIFFFLVFSYNYEAKGLAAYYYHNKSYLPILQKKN